jgi:hypothetical protein
VINVFITHEVHGHLPFSTRNHLPSPVRNYLPLGFLLTEGERPSAALPLLMQENRCTQRGWRPTRSLLKHVDVSQKYIAQISKRVTMMQRKGAGHYGIEGDEG